MTKFKKYKNRKIYNRTTSKYATLADVFQAATEGPVEVLDAKTGEDISSETIVRGAMECFGPTPLKSLAAESVKIGRDFEVDAKISEKVQEAVKTAKEIASMSHSEINDLFSGKEAH